jgi:hypothetical protein
MDESQYCSACIYTVPLESRRLLSCRPRDDKPAKLQHPNVEVQARRLPIAGGSDVLEEIAECFAMELERVRLLSRSQTGFRLQKIKTLRAHPRPGLATVNIVQYCTTLGTKAILYVTWLIKCGPLPKGAIAKGKQSAYGESSAATPLLVNGWGKVSFGRRTSVAIGQQNARQSLCATRACVWQIPVKQTLLDYLAVKSCAGFGACAILNSSNPISRVASESGREPDDGKNRGRFHDPVQTEGIWVTIIYPQISCISVEILSAYL